jgi:formate dehydrogenase subunit gamma
MQYMDDDNLSDLVARHKDRKGALLPLLHDIQHAFGCVDAEAEAAVAKALNLSRAEVHGVVSLSRPPRQRQDGRLI